MAKRKPTGKLTVKLVYSPAPDSAERLRRAVGTIIQSYHNGKAAAGLPNESGKEDVK